MGKKGKDEFDGRLTYEADIGETFELEVDENHYETFRCVEGKNCRGCDFQYMTIDLCLNFPCTKSGRSDGKAVHFKWEGKNA